MEKENSYEFELFRVRLEKPAQGDLLLKFPDRRELLTDALSTKPSIQLKQTVRWHIGNVENSETGWIHFLIGKTSLKKQEHLDEQTRDFLISDGRESPFTHGLLDPESGVLALAKRTLLAPKTRTLAKRFQSILESTEVVFKSNYLVEVKFIPDPHKFISLIRSAYSVRQFQFFVSPSNPIDIDRRFHQPNKDFVDATGADQGMVSIKGPDLNKDVVIRTANSVASVGDDASASIQQSQKKKPIRIHLNGDPAKVIIEESKLRTSQAERAVWQTYEKVKDAKPE